MTRMRPLSFRDFGCLALREAYSHATSANLWQQLPPALRSFVWHLCNARLAAAPRALINANHFFSAACRRRSHAHHSVARSAIEPPLHQDAPLSSARELDCLRE